MKHTGTENFTDHEVAHVGLYVISYEGEGVCKIGVTSDLRSRLQALRVTTWHRLDVAAFFFAYKPIEKFVSVPDNHSITRMSAYALEAACHRKLKELDVHLRGEFFEVFPEEAVQAVNKVASQNDFRLVTPSEILSAGLNLTVRRDDRDGYLGLANAAGLANTAILESQDVD